MQAHEIEERLKMVSIPLKAFIPLEPADRLLTMNFTESNRSLTPEILNDTERFSQYVEDTLAAAGARYGVGGYNEHRTIYSRSAVFNGGSEAEPRRLHLGLDIWGKAGTPISAPLDGKVHSVGVNDSYGDYGATLILEHEINGWKFHTLYGHLSRASVESKNEGDKFQKGDVVAAFGEPQENGQWPPHLHFQLIIDMQGKRGDYLGVCRFSERAIYLANCPDPGWLVNGQW